MKIPTTLVCLFLYTCAHAATVTLGWNESPEPYVGGYNLLQGGTTGVYTNTVRASSSRTITNYQVINLAYGATYFWVLTAISTNGWSSGYSPELVYTVPVPPPVILTQPVGATVNVGMSYTFSVVAAGQGITYHWSRNGVLLSDGVNISGALTPNLTVSSITMTDAGSYIVTVANGGGAINSSVVALTVINPVPAAPTGLRVIGP